MGKLRVVHMGLGDFGSHWFGHVLPHSADVEVVGVVTTNAQKRDWIRRVSGLGDECVFSDEEDALVTLKPDFLLCVTPPGAHKRNILTALDLGIPVVCEKPIAESAEDAEALLDASLKSGIPVIIAENYRYMDIMVRARERCRSGAIGKLRSVNVDFFRCHRMDPKNYHNALRHPLLLDVGIHHLDLLRYVTGLEAVSVEAAAWDYAGTPYSGNSSAAAHIEMERGVHASYFGSLASYARPTTTWIGNWRVTGERGQISIAGDELSVTSDAGDFLERVEENDSLSAMLGAIARDLERGQVEDNDIRNNIRTFRLAQGVMRAADTGCRQRL